MQWVSCAPSVGLHSLYFWKKNLLTLSCQIFANNATVTIQFTICFCHLAGELFEEKQLKHLCPLATYKCKQCHCGIFLPLLSNNFKLSLIWTEQKEHHQVFISISLDTHTKLGCTSVILHKTQLDLEWLVETLIKLWILFQSDTERGKKEYLWTE